MAHKAPGKSYRNGLTLIQLMDLFPDEEAAKNWFAEGRWPEGPHCPHCGSFNVQSDIKHRSMTHRCRDCEDKPMFSMKTGTIMEGSKLGYRVWAIAIYLVATNLKGVSSMKLHRDLGVTQKTAWHLAHRIRKALGRGEAPFRGPVEVDETFMGGKRKNMSHARRKALKGLGRGTAGKTVVVGAKDRATNLVSARVVQSTDAETLQGFVEEQAIPDAQIYTDDAKAYKGMSNPHESVKHSVSEYVRGMAHTNGIESFWSMLKRGYIGTFHHFSEKHTGRYVAEFAGRHNIREQDTLDQMAEIVDGMVHKRLKYRDLVS